MLLLAEPLSVLPPITVLPTLPATFMLLFLELILPSPPVTLPVTLSPMIILFLFAVPWALVPPIISETCDMLASFPIFIWLPFAV
ncbi:hypothetical protein V2I21_08010 [Campylobacter sp. CLAX-22107-21]|uniref:hypothetical protein n=1 Tax=Campylobacter devanensis TaxID=3161138 RepID=UPI002EBA327A|nr:hypothetical protein [Campylobacter sp. CLAX-22107-21]